MGERDEARALRDARRRQRGTCREATHVTTRNESNYAASADDAVVYVAQNARAILGTALRAWLVERALGFACGAVALAISGGATFAIVAAVTTRNTANRLASLFE